MVIAPWRAAGGIWMRTATGAVISPANSQRRHQTPPRRAIPPQVGQGTRSGIVTTAVPPDAASAGDRRSSRIPSRSIAATPAATSVSSGPERRDSRSTIARRHEADQLFAADAPAPAVFPEIVGGLRVSARAFEAMGVVRGAGGRVRQHAVRLRDLREPRRALRPGAVGVMLERELAVGAAQLGRRRRRGHAEHLVEVVGGRACRASVARERRPLSLTLSPLRGARGDAGGDGYAPAPMRSPVSHGRPARRRIELRRRMPLTTVCSQTRQARTRKPITQKQLSGRPVDFSR